MTPCKNCDQHFEGKFCNNCGQTANTHRLSMHFILHELQHSLFHVDHGILYTMQQLLIRPGHMIREFMEGKRVRHFKPMMLVVVLATVYGLLFHYFMEDVFDIDPIHSKDGLVSAYQKMLTWVTGHLAYASLLLIAVNTICSYLLFRKQGFNFAEHLVLNTYAMGLVLIDQIVLFPVLYIYSHSDTGPMYALISQTVQLILFYWCYAQFFNELPKLKSLSLTILSFLMFSAVSVLVGYLFGAIMRAVS